MIQRDWEAPAEAAREMARLARKLDVAIIVVSQVRRGVLPALDRASDFIFLDFIDLPASFSPISST